MTEKDKPEKPRKKPKIKNNPKHQVEIEIEPDTYIMEEEFTQDLSDFCGNDKKDVVICGKKMMANQSMAAKLAIVSKAQGHRVSFRFPKGINKDSLTLANLGLEYDIEEGDSI